MQRNSYKKQVDIVKAQKKKLEDLCRVLQTERAQQRQHQPNQQHQPSAPVKSNEDPEVVDDEEDDDEDDEEIIEQ